MTCRPLQPLPEWATAAAWVGLGAYVATADWHLIRRGNNTLSTYARTHPRATAAVCLGLSAHLLGSFRLDPLRLAGDWLTRR